MQLVDKNITRVQLVDMAKKTFGKLVKAVIDIEKKTMVVDASLHADEEAFLLTQGSNQKNLWGINLYPELSGEDFVEFDSMINLCPGQGNMTRSVDDTQIQDCIRKIVSELVS